MSRDIPFIVASARALDC